MTALRNIWQMCDPLAPAPPGVHRRREMEVRERSSAPEYLAKGAAALEAAFAAGRQRCGVAHVTQHVGRPDPSCTGAGCLICTESAGVYEVRTSCEALNSRLEL
jgi:hypothetical protein